MLLESRELSSLPKKIPTQLLSSVKRLRSAGSLLSRLERKKKKLEVLFLGFAKKLLTFIESLKMVLGWHLVKIVS
jgi:hypothetical protein